MKSSSFRKWVQGEASQNQKEYWDQWVKDDSENRKLANQSLQKIVGFSIQEEYVDTHVEQSWNELDKKLMRVSRLKEAQSIGSKGNAAITWILRVSAVLLLATVTGITVYFYYPQDVHVQKQQYFQNEVKTDYREQKQINLSDGSRITLNAHSKLNYKVNNENPQNVQVSLEGEAYFSIAQRNRSNPLPFRVRTEGENIEVLGTEFVVSTRNSKTRVVLEEGSVAVEPLTKTGEQVLLTPGEMTEFGSSWDGFHIQKVNTKVYTSWKSKELVFDETPLSEIIDRLEYTYGVDVTVQDSNLFGQRITGSIDNTELDIVISALSRTLDTTVHIGNNTVYFGI